MQCVLLRPYPVAAEGAAERRRGGVHEEIARPDGGLNCARGPIPFTSPGDGSLIWPATTRKVKWNPVTSREEYLTYLTQVVLAPCFN
jgi:hypothetical protein